MKILVPAKYHWTFLGINGFFLIIRDLFRKRYTFSEFLHKNTEERIASNVLSDRLKKLIALKIIDFNLNSHNRKIKEYYLTDSGIELYNIIFELQIWAINNVDFKFSNNTTEWSKELEVKNKEIMIEEKKSNYREFRKKEFNF